MDRYNFGVATGHNDVTNNPNNYGLYNQAQYDQNYNNGYNAGKADSPGQITDWIYVDATVTDFGTYNLSSYIPGDHKIKGVGMISRSYYGWFGFSLSFTDTTFSLNKTSPEYGSVNNAVIRIWYI